MGGGSASGGQKDAGWKKEEINEVPRQGVKAAGWLPTSCWAGPLDLEEGLGPSSPLSAGAPKASGDVTGGV